ncbi:pescadillo-family protein [Coprinopsis marcescibilis]|uniref:Pescadillo homolog n=1 Tax=Coprinopsis marcescibilis TaxID=230819 RepID=A0A5C3LBX7_COPMA|nr:pescadillo-family protein [Coprinopsis marcescibilis]
MARIKQRGKAGAAKNYVTRTAAVRKLQCSLADFRRLCILKGIFPREPNNRKKANKGSSAPTSFYYAKDIAYLAHEPVLKRLREHKAFAKKLSRALGRGEWSAAKSLEENKPIYRLDHIIKERYPTFVDALRDIDDALCMIFLFATLPSTARLPRDIVDNCAQLAMQWQLYVMHSQSLRRVFLSIKGVYYQAEIMDQQVTWLVPYQFTQNIPTDVDVRVMLTFLELYQTLLGFVLFKLFTDINLVYPPPLDIKKEDMAAGVGALSIQDSQEHLKRVSNDKNLGADGKKISGKDVRQTIKSIVGTNDPQADAEMEDQTSTSQELEDEQFVTHASKANPEASSDLPTLHTITTSPSDPTSRLFAPYTIWLSRETSRSIFEFAIRSLGGRVGWPASSGAGSPFDESDESITHVVIDRPVVQKEEPATQRELRLRRKYVQPQWVVDCINAGKILLEDDYAQGKLLPPHLSPFGELAGAYDPRTSNDVNMEETSDAENDNEEPVESDENNVEDDGVDAALASVTTDDPASLRAAELAAEAAGLDYGEFESKVKKIGKKGSVSSNAVVADAESDMNKMMMSNKQKKLYEKMKYSQQKQTAEREKLQRRQQALQKKQTT